MDARRYEQLSRAFEEAVDLQGAERIAVIQALEVEDASLAAELRAMLASDEESRVQEAFDEEALRRNRDAFDGVVADGATTLPTGDLVTPARIGPFRVVRLLGQGGMGAVYLAEQTEPFVRTVAVKVIRSGLSRKSITRRFELEREALSRMDDPGIARVLDAGLDDDKRPYFAMEYVEGQRLDVFCDERGLDVEARLRLLLEVARSVQHAHQRGILHRDLKPSNLLVSTQDGATRTKVIDFGLARAVDARATLGTMTTDGEVLGTLAYMSPEQARLVDADVDTRTDVYSLGIVMYELLTGRLPAEDERGRRSLANLLDRERSSVRPSNRFATELDTRHAVRRAATTRGLRRVLSGDLDWIVLRAIEPRPDDRYASVSEFANDIEAYLEYRPVVAGPPSTLYRLKKLVRRHRLAAAGIATALVALVAGAIVSAAMAWRALEAEDRARSTVRELEAQNDVLVHMLSTSDTRHEGIEATLGDLLERGASYVRERYPERPRTLATVLGTIGATYREQGVLDDAEACLLDAIEAWERVDDADPTQLPFVHNSLGVLYSRMGQTDKAIERFETALRLMSAEPPSEERRSAEAVWSFNLGRVYIREGRTDDAERWMQRAHALHGTLDGDQERLYFSHVGLGEVARSRGDYEAAVTHFMRALDRARKKFPEGHVIEAAALQQVGVALIAAGRIEEASEYTAKALRIAETQYEEGTVYMEVYASARVEWCIRTGHGEEADRILRPNG
ncbi:Serine/threonine-protein kinase Pkn1 [Planctomycetes bacterium Poly30]|uniref:Serine/threonine-protein kinase Pkn1 n=1 Tax=Saltatorellus ferox TaxID=2528018 RepID=A0A518EYX9_9BACT|nr:Serine/threonine-protein kinase Pkn1 [Planctomycetes bacterium Poly30]